MMVVIILTFCVRYRWKVSTTRTLIVSSLNFDFIGPTLLRRSLEGHRLIWLFLSFFMIYFVWCFMITIIVWPNHHGM